MCNFELQATNSKEKERKEKKKKEKKTKMLTLAECALSELDIVYIKRVITFAPIYNVAL